MYLLYLERVKPEMYQSDPSIIPSLSIHNAGKKSMVVKRGEEIVYINPASSEDLQDGDVVDIITGVSLR